MIFSYVKSTMRTEVWFCCYQMASIIIIIINIICIAPWSPRMQNAEALKIMTQCSF